MKPAVQTYELKCKSCGGTLNYEEGSDVLVCPYCGAREILAESDAVKIEKIRSDAYKEVELGRQKLMAAQMEKTAKKNYRKTKTYVFSVILLILSAFGLLLAAAGNAPACVVVALVQIGLLIVSILMMRGVIKGKLAGLSSLAVILAAALIFVYLLMVVYSTESSRTSYRSNEEITWDDMLLSDALPDPGITTGHVYSNSSDRINMDIDPYEKKDFSAYVKACKEAGYTVDVLQPNEGSFTAYNEEGYRVDLYYFNSSGYMSLSLDAPVEMSELIWPAHGLPKLLPAPSSTFGKIESDSANYFIAYIGNTSKTDYSTYVTAVQNAGFDVDYYRNDSSFGAKNEDGIRVSIDYEGFQTMHIRISDYTK